MKKIVVLLLALVMLLAMTACGKDEEGTPTGESTGATTSTTESTNDTTEGTQDNTQGSTGNSTGGNQNNTQEASGNNQSNLQGSTNNTASSENTTTGNNSPTTLPSAQASHSYTEIGNVIPVGGAYVFRKNYESIYEGTIPTSPSVGDYFYYGDYRYEFVCINNKYGWDVYAESLTDGTQYKSSYGNILLSINDFPIIAMTSTFHSNPKIKTAPSIPTTVVDMTQTFHSCTALVSAPKLPEELRTMSATFADCPALKIYDGAEQGTPDGDFSKYNIPSKVSNNDIVGAFYACPRIQVLPREITYSNPTPSTPTPSEPPAACNHSWKSATCITPKTCTKCGTTSGNAIGHKWHDANCTAPKTCKTCGATEGSTTAHNWKAATCTAPKTCKTCGATDGSAVGHSWSAATCTTPKTCKTCGATEGTANGHKWLDGKCEVCSTIRTEYTTEKFLDELEGVSFTYVGITYDPYGSSKGFSIWFQVVNSTDEMILVQSRNEKVNGHSCWTNMSNYIAPNTTQTVELYVAASDSTLSPTLNDYGEDMVEYVEFNFYVGFNDRENNKHFISNKDIFLYPYK